MSFFASGRKAAVFTLLLLALTPAVPAKADTLEFWQNRNSRIDWSPFEITPFDSTLGTLNGVTVVAELNVSGSAQLWTTSEEAELSVSFSTTLAAFPELGWGTTSASFAKSAPLWYFDYDVGEGYVQLDGSGNKVAYTTITANFGRFLGPTPFMIGLWLSGQATSTEPEESILVSSQDGTASLYYSYEFTPASVPEPSALSLLGIGFAITLAPRRRKR